jgi:hypothetical protein
MKPDGDVDRRVFSRPLTGLNSQPLLPNRCSGFLSRLTIGLTRAAISTHLTV